MTTQSRSLVTPALDAQAFAARATARSVHAFTLADLANDAAGGHPSQRWALSRRESGTWHGFYEADSTAEWLVVRAVLSRKGVAVLTDTTTLALTVTDGTTVANTLAEGIPDGLRADRGLVLPSGAVWMARHEALGVHLFRISLAKLRSVLTASTHWRFKLVIATGSSHYVESFTIEEASRFAIDTGDAFGQLPQSYLPRGLVVDGDPGGLPRIGATLEAAFDKSRRTYHAASVEESTPWTTSSTSYATLAGDAEPGGAAVQHVTRGRRMRDGADCRVRFRVRYKITGASTGDTATIRLHTGGGSSPYALVLADTAGTWADSNLAVGYIKTSGTDYLDTLYWSAKTTSGTLAVCARGVWDHPL